MKPIAKRTKKVPKPKTPKTLGELPKEEFMEVVRKFSEPLTPHRTGQKRCEGENRMKPIAERTQKVPLTKSRVMQSSSSEVHPVPVNVLAMPPHRLRRAELSRLHSIPENAIFVDPKNGVELYKTSQGTWATSPGY